MMKLLRKEVTPRPVPAAELPRPAPLPPNASEGKRWRWRRDLAIYICHRAGLSERMLADVFLLTRSRVNGIIKAFGERLGEGASKHGSSPCDESA